MGEASDGKKAGTMEGRIERLADSVQQAQKVSRPGVIA